MLSKEVSSTIFKVFVMTWPGIEPRSPRPLANTLPKELNKKKRWRKKTDKENHRKKRNKRNSQKWLILMICQLILFYASRLGNHTHCTFIFTFFCVVVSQEFLCTLSYDITHSYLVQMIHAQLNGFKYSYLILIFHTYFII